MMRTPLALSIVAGLAFPASGVDRVWSNTSGGLVATSTNWSPVGVPTGADRLEYSLPNTYTVTYGSGTPFTNSLSMVRGNVTFRCTSPHTINASATFGVDASGGPITTFNLGTLDAQSHFVGFTSNSTAVLNVAGQARLTGRLAVRIGSSGDGTLDVSGRSTVSAPTVTVGDSTGSTGTVTIRDGSAIQGFSRLEAGTSLTVGVNGFGTVDVIAGGQLRSSGSMSMAISPGSTGIVDVSGTDSRVAVTTDLGIGRNLGNTASGSASLRCGIGGLVTVDGFTRIGDPQGGSGTLHIDGGSVRTGSLAVETVGALDFENGLLIIDGGVFQPRNGTATIAGDAGSDSCTLQLVNGADWVATGNVNIGTRTGTSGRMEVLTGSAASSTTAINITSASQLNSVGTLVVSGTGSRLGPTPIINVGQASQGVLSVLGGGRVECVSAVIGRNATGSGLVTLAGEDSFLTASDSIAVGGSASAAGGTSRVVVGLGSVVSVSGSNPVSMIVHPNSSTLDIQSGGVGLAHDLDLRGTLVLTDGVLAAEDLRTSASTRIQGRGRILANIDAALANTAVLTLTGSLEVGPQSGIGGFVWSGELNVGSHALTIRQPIGVGRLGDVSIAGGSIAQSQGSNPLSLLAGDRIMGDGTVTANLLIDNDASVTTFGSAGLVFTAHVGPLDSAGCTLLGNRFVFSGTDSGFFGHGAIDCNFLDVLDGTIHATGNLRLGINTNSAVNFDGGRLDIGGHEVRFRQTSVVEAAAVTDIRGGSLVATTYRLENDGQPAELNGRGFFFTDLVNVGVISPEGLSAGTPGVIDVRGNYTMTSGGSVGALLMDLTPSLGFGSTDLISVEQAAEIAGSLTVRLTEGFVATRGYFWPLVVAQAGVSGAFDAVALPAGFVLYHHQQGVYLYYPCISDIDADADSDSDDIVAFFGFFESGEGGGDTDNDGDVDSDDILLFFDAFESGC